jgi:drug/metabolite transporter (DMT)-like permease
MPDGLEREPSIRSIAAMLLLALMWGVSIPVTKLGLLTLPPLMLTALRFAFAMPFLLPFFFGRRRLPWREVPKVAALGIVGVGVGQVAQAYGVAGTSASVGTIISATIPVFVVIFAAIRLKQPVSNWQKLGLLAAFAGIGLVALQRGDAAAPASTVMGAAWMLISALTIAFYYVWSVEISRAYGTGALAAWSTLFGLLAMLPWAGWEMRHLPFRLTGEGLAAVLYLGVVVTAAGLFIWLALLRTVPARVAASVQYLQPVVGIVASAAIFGDRLGALFAAGVVLVFAGLALTVMSRAKPAGVEARA